MTLWELTSLCQQRPWPSMANETQLLASVIQRYQTPEASLNSSLSSSTSSSSGLSAASTGDALIGAPNPALMVMPRPAHCPNELYRLMCQCWQQEPGQRPRFADIHSYLQRKFNAN